MSVHQLLKAKRKAESLFQQQRWAEARVVHKKICRDFPGDADNWLDYGVVSGILGELPEAEAAFRRALQLNPHLPQAYFNLGKLLAFRGRMHEAEPYLRSYVALMSAVAEGQYQLARVLMNMGRLHESLSYFQEALRLAPGSVEVLLDHSSALQFLGRFDEAEECLQQALERAPNNAAILLRLAHLHGLRRCFEAAERFDRALALQPDNAELRLERAFNLLRLGRYEEGWREYQARTGHPRWRDEMAAYTFSRPRWDSASLAGRTLLVYAEQGFGRYPAVRPLSAPAGRAG